nr:metalloproteinase inhibitor 2-like [Oncorhynchus nerka]
MVSNAIKYDIQQIKMFKCPDQVIHAIFTAPSPAACGVTLDLNKEYLFTGEVLTTLPTFCCQYWLTLCPQTPAQISFPYICMSSP